MTKAGRFIGTNNIAIGNVGSANDGISANSGVIRIGTIGTLDTQGQTFIAGIRGATVTGSAVLIDTTTGQLGVASSSARVKQDIEAMGAASRGLLALRPVTFRYRTDSTGARRQYGLIAEEVEAVYPELVTRGADGTVQGVRYHELPAMLLNEWQAQARESARQADTLARQEAALQRQAAVLAQQARDLAALRAENTALRASQADALATLSRQVAELAGQLMPGATAGMARSDRAQAALASE